MPKFNVSYNHRMERASVVERLQGFSENVRRDSTVEISEISEEWDADGNLAFSFKAMGMTISGAMHTSDSDVVVKGNLPFAAAMFRGAIEKQIRDKIQEALEL